MKLIDGQEPVKRTLNDSKIVFPHQRFQNLLTFKEEHICLDFTISQQNTFFNKNL